MINYVTGIIKSCKSQSIFLLVGPIGLELWVPDGSLFHVGQEKAFFAYLHWNQEQGPSLYGFGSEQEKLVFVLIISCSGIGPKIALAVLADLGAHGFLQAIQEGDERMLSKVNGIGLKKAEQMIVQLKHKVGPLLEAYPAEGVQQVRHWHTVTQALQALNYSRTEVTHAVHYLKANQKQADSSFDQLLRQALAFLSKQS